MEWRDRIIYHRDFAYSTGRARMASGNIGEVPAATFAEYVQQPLPSSGDQVHGSALYPPSDQGSHIPEDSNAHADDPSEHARKVSAPSCAVRPGLWHRLYSHHLHVRAQAKLQRDRLLSGSMIDVYVGKSARHWSLHRNLLSHHSELLEEELRADGKERLDLPEHDPAGFELLVKWLYQGQLDDVGDVVDANQKYEYAVSCHKLYLLCERFHMSSLKNLAMDQYRKGLYEAELVPDADEINEIYRASTDGSPFKRLVTRIAARQIMDPNCTNDVETYRQCFENNADFAVDLVKAIKAGTGGTLFEDPTERGRDCDYHDHEVGPNCQVKGKSAVKSALKASTLRGDPKNVKFDDLARFDPLRRPRHPIPLPMTIPPLRHARPQSGGHGPLRRRLTSPATSTAGTSLDMATATATSPSPPPRPRFDELRRSSKEDSLNAKHRMGSQSNPIISGSPPVSSDDGHRDHRNSKNNAQPLLQYRPGSEQLPATRGLWQWARMGRDRIGTLTWKPHSDIPTKDNTSDPSAETFCDDAAVSQDDFSVPSATTTNVGGVASGTGAPTTKGFDSDKADSSVDSFWAQPEYLSDDILVSANGSLSSQPSKSRLWAGGTLRWTSSHTPMAASNLPTN